MAPNRKTNHRPSRREYDTWRPDDYDRDTQHELCPRYTVPYHPVDMERIDSRNSNKRHREELSPNGGIRKVPRLTNVPVSPEALPDELQKQCLDQIPQSLVDLISATIEYQNRHRDLKKISGEHDQVKDWVRTFGKSSRIQEEALQRATSKHETAEKNRKVSEDVVNQIFRRLATMLVAAAVNGPDDNRVDSPAGSSGFLAQEVRILQDQRVKAENLQATIRNLVDGIDDKHDSLEKRVEQYEYDQNNRCFDIRKSQREYADKQQRMDDHWQKRYQELDAEHRGLKQEVALIINDMKSMQERIAKAESMQKSYSDMEDKIDKATGSISAAATEVSRAKQKLGSPESTGKQWKELETKLKAMDKRADSHNSSIKAINDNVNNLSTRNHSDLRDIKTKLELVEKASIEQGKKAENVMTTVDQRLGRFTSKQAIEERESNMQSVIAASLQDVLNPGSAICRNIVDQAVNASKTDIDAKLSQDRTELEARLRSIEVQSTNGATIAMKEIQAIKDKQAKLPDVSKLETDVDELKRQNHEVESRFNVFTHARNEFRQVLEYNKKPSQQPARPVQRTPIRRPSGPATSPVLPSQPQIALPSPQAQPSASSSQQPIHVNPQGHRVAGPDNATASSPLQGVPHWLPPVFPPQQQGRIQMTPSQQQGHASHSVYASAHVPPAQLPQQSPIQHGGPLAVQLNEQDRLRMSASVFDGVVNELMKPGSMLRMTQGMAERALAQAQQAVTNSEHALNRANQNTQGSSGDFSGLQNEINRLATRMDQQGAQAIQLMTAANNASSQANRATDKHDDLEKRFNKFERGESGIGSRFGDGTPRTTTPQSTSPGPSDTATVRSDLNRLIQDYQALNEKVDLRGGDIEDLKTGAADHAVKMDSRISSIEEMIRKQLVDEMLKLTNTHACFEDTPGQLRSSHEHLKTEDIAPLRALTEQHENQITFLRNRVDDHREQLKQANLPSLPDLHKAVEDSSNQLHDLEKLDLPAMKAALGKAERDIKKLLARFGPLRNSIKRIEIAVEIPTTDFPAEDKIALGRMREAEEKRAAQVANTNGSS
ncbi:Hypothetical protein D9617_5g070670 [Elsinoe fawcettii]|nr:Hypothetical protein D9617_5g070670 [Elsinoe fawcettii]